METTAKILAKAGNGKAAKLDDGNWYNFDDASSKYLAKFNKGDSVTVTYERKGTARNVTKIVKATETQKEEPKESSTGFACEDCGAELKDGRFKKCYNCNKKVSKEEKKTNSKKEYKSYDSPDRTANIQRGNALNAAAMVASGEHFGDPEAAQQYTLILADAFLDWLRAE